MNTDDALLFNACIEGNIGLVKERHARDRIRTDIALESICEADFLNIVQRIYFVNKISTQANKRIFERACLCGRLNIVEWIYSVAPWIYPQSNISIDDLTSCLELLANAHSKSSKSSNDHARTHTPSKKLQPILQFLLERGANIQPQKNKLLTAFSSWEDKLGTFTILLPYCTEEDYCLFDEDVVKQLLCATKSARNA